MSQAPAVDAALPLFYKRPILLRFEEHKSVGLAAPKGFGFAREAVAVPLCAGEFAIAQRYYPVVFSADDHHGPLAVLGVKEGENLFVGADGAWNPGRYVPAYVRRYPFIVTETPDKAAQLLAIDGASDRLVDMATDSKPADALFDDRGAPTTAASEAMAFCNAYHQEHLKTQVFVEALADAGLLVTNHAQMQFPDGSRYTLDGFMSVDERKFRDLPATRVAEWHTKGWLDLVALHLVSRQNWQGLLNLHLLGTNEREEAA